MADEGQSGYLSKISGLFKKKQDPGYVGKVDDFKAYMRTDMRDNGTTIEQMLDDAKNPAFKQNKPYLHAAVNDRVEQYQRDKGISDSEMKTIQRDSGLAKGLETAGFKEGFIGNLTGSNRKNLSAYNSPAERSHYQSVRLIYPGPYNVESKLKTDIEKEQFRTEVYPRIREDSRQFDREQREESVAANSNPELPNPIKLSAAEQKEKIDYTLAGAAEAKRRTEALTGPGGIATPKDYAAGEVFGMDINAPPKKKEISDYKGSLDALKSYKDFGDYAEANGLPSELEAFHKGKGIDDKYGPGDKITEVLDNYRNSKDMNEEQMYGFLEKSGWMKKLENAGYIRKDRGVTNALKGVPVLGKAFGSKGPEYTRFDDFFLKNSFSGNKAVNDLKVKHGKEVENAIDLLKIPGRGDISDGEKEINRLIGQFAKENNLDERNARSIFHAAYGGKLDQAGYGLNREEGLLRKDLPKLPLTESIYAGTTMPVRRVTGDAANRTRELTKNIAKDVVTGKREWLDEQDEQHRIVERAISAKEATVGAVQTGVGAVKSGYEKASGFAEEHDLGGKAKWTGEKVVGGLKTGAEATGNLVYAATEAPIIAARKTSELAREHEVGGHALEGTRAIASAAGSGVKAVAGATVGGAKEVLKKPAYATRFLATGVYRGVDNKVLHGGLNRTEQAIHERERRELSGGNLPALPPGGTSTGSFSEQARALLEQYQSSTPIDDPQVRALLDKDIKKR